MWGAMRNLFLFLFLSTSLVSAQTKNQSISHLRTIPANAISNAYDVPQTKLEFAWTALTGKLVWKHVSIKLSPLTGSPVFWIENMTYPLPYHLDHDPRNVVLTNTSLDFDAVAGDLIYWRVGAQ